MLISHCCDAQIAVIGTCSFVADSSILYVEFQRTGGEDWTQISDLAERRRIQNRRDGHHRIGEV
jgi:hypothetical protein